MLPSVISLKKLPILRFYLIIKAKLYILVNLQTPITVCCLIHFNFMLRKIAFTALAFHFFALAVLSQTKTNRNVLEKTSREYRETELKSFQKAVTLAKEK